MGIDLHHPVKSPEQNAAETPWRVYEISGSTRPVEKPTNPGSIGSPMQTVWHELLDGVADEVYASHFMEHVHRGQPLLDVMNEAWRVLKPGGTFTMIMPLVGFTNPYDGQPMSNQIGWQPWADPTHVNYWWFPEALWYFCEGPFKPHANYGIEVWAPLDHYAIEADIPKWLERKKGHTGSFWGVRSMWEGVARLTKP